MSALRRLDRGAAANLVVEDLREGEVNRPPLEAAHDPREDLGERVEVVAAFEGDRDSVAAEAGPRSPRTEGRSP